MLQVRFKSDKLYVRTSFNIQEWQVLVIEKGFGGSAIVRRMYGIVNGKLIENSYMVTEGKNIGKRNETNAIEQAIKEAKVEVTNKINEGYRSAQMLNINIESSGDLLNELKLKLPLDRVDRKGVSKPMKAVPFSANKFEYPAIIQPKINGVRVHARYMAKQFGMFEDEPTFILDSKEGHEYSVPHISWQFERIVKQLDPLAIEGFMELKPIDLVFDGELYIPREKSPTIKGAATNKKNPLHGKVFFIVFDLAVRDVTQMERLAILNRIFRKTSNEDINYITSNPGIIFLTSEIVNNESEALAKAAEYLELGFEGAILRDPHATYNFGGRRKNMMKIKKQYESKFILVNIIPEEKRPTHGQAVCKNDDGSDTLFPCSINGTFAEREYYLKNKHLFVGKSVVVGYFERTINNLPFHARVLNME